ncbi:glycosyltransferase family 9 protein [Saccharopolyspora rhizosphaerae]|uniref:Glycosyltransferase family 9 protein n=1 Tax=Saccharopolyspora rhizosphaerae TaxID=2492662 RepID=A0A426JLV6_9PSEU|nr:glycosyltransferase family 9 protein [Saccharopolyspora rhizosphaerae]RRO14199.1 glycosyltransferase family 9 protein [Saccharopolyspora rhizosphaerae]
MTATVLVLRALGLGDLLTAVPALRGLRRAYPRHRVLLAAPAPLGALLGLLPEVDELAPTSGLAGFRWERRAPDVAVNLHGSGPESVRAVRSTGARRIVSHPHPAVPEVHGPAWDAEQHERQRWCRLLRHHGLEADPDDLLLPVPPEPPARPGAVLVHPGASHGARRWPVERYAEVARWASDAGLDVVVTGSGPERARASRVAELAGLDPESVLAGRTGLCELAALVAHARLLVCGDTGIAHLASAFHTPSVVLFGPVAPRLWGPPVSARHAALWHGRHGDTFASEPDPGLLALTTEQVLGAAREVLRAA